MSRIRTCILGILVYSTPCDFFCFVLDNYSDPYFFFTGTTFLSFLGWLRGLIIWSASLDVFWKFLIPRQWPLRCNFTRFRYVCSCVFLCIDSRQAPNKGLVKLSTNDKKKKPKKNIISFPSSKVPKFKREKKLIK